MSTIAYPTLQQVKDMRANCVGCKKYRVIAVGSRMFQSDTSFLIWDDFHQLLHIIRGNNEFTTQTKAPIMITSLGYDFIEFIEPCFDNKEEGSK